MRVINLDETGIKLVSAKKKQIYLSIAEVKEFLARKYTLNENTLIINNKSLELSDSECEDFDSTFDYINGIYTKG